MALDYLSELSIKQFIALALAEDVGEGDFTSKACIPEAINKKAACYIKGEGILAGVNLAERVFLHVDPTIRFERKINDGKPVKFGDIPFTVSGNAQKILTAERLVLNCMQRMSGIATYTHSLQSLISHTKAKVLDTRKTTPNFRLMEKWAVVIGGGTNHRYDLSDMIMIKDNHVDYAGGIKEALEAVDRFLKEKDLTRKVIIETRNIAEVEQVLKTGRADRILLDNMSINKLSEAVGLIDGKLETEASGGITEDTLKAVAETGVDFISVGALTHSYKSLDISLKATKE